jgi:hypothetical protein
MSDVKQRTRLVVARNERGCWDWHIFLGASPIAAAASDNSFISKRTAQAAGSVAVQRLVARLQDEQAFDRYLSLQRGTPLLDRKARFFVGKRINRLLRAVVRCQDVLLRGDLVRMAERWTREAAGVQRPMHSPPEMDQSGDAPSPPADMTVG